jgi:subtilase family serine protease
MVNIRRSIGRIIAVAGATALVLLNSVVIDAAGGPPLVTPHQNVPVCPGPADPGSARCHSRQRTEDVGIPRRPNERGAASGAALGNGGAYDPAYLQLAYNLQPASASNGTGQTVAIVDAYDAPNAESDLAYYRNYFGLPPCSSASGCFNKVNQSGGRNFPRPNSGWAAEISLDLEMVSAICPNCHILLVEASSNGFANLATAMSYAAGHAANAVSNSYGGSEFSGETAYDSAYGGKSGVAVTVSSGDNGYGVDYPAASPYVTAVGGTTLVVPTGSGRQSETVWNGAGSGCSAYEAQQSWQSALGSTYTSKCGKRMVADVSAVADPNTGVWVYDTYGQYHGWYVFGGTSVASPIVASVYALAGNASTVSYGSSSYKNTSSLFDITNGSNSSCGNYLCTAESGYDGPTGNGTPNGPGGF